MVYGARGEEPRRAPGVGVLCVAVGGHTIVRGSYSQTLGPACMWKPYTPTSIWNRRRLLQQLMLITDSVINRQLARFHGAYFTLTLLKSGTPAAGYLPNRCARQEHLVHPKSYTWYPASFNAGGVAPPFHPTFNTFCFPTPSCRTNECIAGGVAPPAPDAPPSGGGVTQLLKDTLTGPTSTAADQARDQDQGQTTEKQGPIAGQGYKPDLSAVLPSDEAMVYGGEREQRRRFKTG
jgi:hypothetical protein